MEHTKPCIGIDISKPFLDCYAIPAGKSRRFTNSSNGIKACLKWIGKFNAIHRIILEPTGGYEKPMMRALHQEKRPVSCVNARYIHHFAIAKQDRAKTDQLDAKTLAEYGRAMSPRLTTPPCPHKEKLEALIERRKVIQDMLLAEQNRLAQADQELVKKSIECLIDHLEQEKRNFTKAIEELLESAPLKEAYELLLAMPGVGALSAANLLAYLPELGTLDPKSVARLVGVAPMNHDSGKSVGQKRIRGGRKTLRCALYMATLVGVRHNPALKKFYDRLVLKGKAKKVALTAAMRKLLIWLNAQMARKLAGQKIFNPA